MSHSRTTAYLIDQVFLDRWSPRSFMEKEVSDEVLFSLFEAARWAPSALNIQPWRFILARTQDDREKFYSFIFEGNLAWCRKAPVLALIISEMNNEKGLNKSHAFDSGAAWGFLSLEATKKGLITHPMTGFDFEAARKVLDIPEKYAINALVAIGYQGEKEDLPEILQQRENPSPRRETKDSLFEGSFGHQIKEYVHV
ncbi:nitroreductase family protein [Bacillus sp. DTU_2020_1000418_1_SI_GHA_SEK_038]|uniref:nitroreductase family protein n=1 Tax=Bacillus sp. DTU_2020_1000418_1_SI_GHA_SEK_038 TaxID=3077585 RepID=UPI0028EDA541|nr:nitroreductase family protein [Bacillus sp. DTU_2020_1000418_1_SI_GHA_SEK_038]WNS75715.1 nitroreductase family protein [Bacillus sp. DTU_2020_1000418_1_SI_GHA_SEK_038]